MGKMAYNIEELFILPNDTILKALHVIDKAGDNGTKVALVINKAKKLVGIINDGDIRRALLKNPSLEQFVCDVMNASFISVSEHATRISVLEKMKACEINQIPVIDKDKNILGLHLLKDFIELNALPNIAVIMVGGKGMRLRPITKELPKPMVKVAGTPILAHIIHHLVGYGIKNVYLAVNYMSEIIEDYFGDGADFGCKINYLRETQPLGTAGALSLLPKIEDDFLLMNGDLITQFHVKNMFAFHKNSKNALTIGAKNYSTKIPYGVLKIKEDKVLDIQEKPELHYPTNGGVYILSPNILANIPDNQVYYATDIIENCLENNEKVGYYFLEEDWIDVGEHEQLANARGNP